MDRHNTLARLAESEAPESAHSRMLPGGELPEKGPFLRHIPGGTAKSGAPSFSRDEMNLAEFPLTVLSTRADPKVKTLEFSDQLRTKNGDIVERKWIITGADKFGLPTSTDDDVILGLIRLSMDDGFRNRKVYFSRYELLKALRWSTEGRSYSRLTKSLDRLSGVRIRAANSFYDNNSKSYQTCNFGIVDSYEINDHRSKKTSGEAPRSFFVWSEMIFDSFRAGFIKKLDLDLYFSLKSAVSRRLYRYLDKHFYYKSVIEKPLMLLAFEKLGLSRSYRFVSSIKQQLEPAIEELTRCGFLARCEVLGKGESATIRFVAGHQVITGGQGSSSEPPQNALFSARHADRNAARNAAGNTERPKERPSESYSETRSHHGAQAASVLSNAHVRDQTIEALVSRGITVSQAKRLLERKSASDLEAIERIIQYYDFLVETNDVKVSRSKVGFLYRAVESPFKFVVPAQFENGSPKAAAKKRPEHEIRTAKDPISPAKSPLQEKTALERYREFLDAQISAGVRKLGAEEIARIHTQVETKMECLKSALSSERFQEALSGCVKEELVKQLKLPDFESWNLKRRAQSGANR